LNQTTAEGFSLFELLIAMTITLVLLGLSSALLASSFRFRTRENQRTEALADSQRGLNLITREIANSGYGLTDNGISRCRHWLNFDSRKANLNASEGETTSNSATDKDEDVKFPPLYDSGNSYIVPSRR